MEYSKKNNFKILLNTKIILNKHIYSQKYGCNKLRTINKNIIFYHDNIMIMVCKYIQLISVLVKKKYTLFNYVFLHMIYIV